MLSLPRYSYERLVRKLNTAPPVRAKALIRWQHPELGFMMLNDFILKIGQWVIQGSCAVLARFDKLHSTKLALALNLFTKQIENDQLFDQVKTAIALNNIDTVSFGINNTSPILKYSQGLKSDVYYHFSARLDTQHQSYWIFYCPSQRLLF
ncbi:EAL domain-containing protein [Glaciecola punicea]|uniref:EAL domain-containing protein n=1 Tax=Glaciecola punicea TaxID=56804 RepID=UPI0013054446|nr:EAL domain-containing protein [Glaciecola punicea]